MFYIQYQSLVNGKWFRSKYSKAYYTREAADERIVKLNAIGSGIKFRVVS